MAAKERRADAGAGRVTAGSASQSRLPAEGSQGGPVWTVAAEDRCCAVSLPRTVAKVAQGQARSQGWKCPRFSRGMRSFLPFYVTGAVGLLMLAKGWLVWHSRGLST